MNIITPKNSEIKDILFDCRDIAIRLLDKDDLKKYVICIPKDALFQDKKEHSYEEVKQILQSKEGKIAALTYVRDELMDMRLFNNFKASMRNGIRRIGCNLKKPVYVLSPIWS